MLAIIGYTMKELFVYLIWYYLCSRQLLESSNFAIKKSNPSNKNTNADGIN
jgi:hypothetical protein